MSLVKGQVNPLNVVKCRRLNYIPPHFEKMKLNHGDHSLFTFIDQWIYNHLNSRYGLRYIQHLDTDRKITDVLEVGFEDGKELTMFSLACPYLNKN